MLAPSASSLANAAIAAPDASIHTHFPYYTPLYTEMVRVCDRFGHDPLHAISAATNVSHPTDASAYVTVEIQRRQWRWYGGK